jgi:hypothetical protein
MSAWLDLADVLVEEQFSISRLLDGGLSIKLVLKALRVLCSTVEETRDQMKEVIEQPFVAGLGFLYRAKHEEGDIEQLLKQAQSEFTKLIEIKTRAILSSRSSYFVGVCHTLLSNESNARLHYVDAINKYLVAAERSERRRHEYVMPDNEIEEDYMIPYHTVGYGWHERDVIGPDEYRAGLEKTVGLCIPLPCDLSEDRILEDWWCYKSLRHRYFCYAPENADANYMYERAKSVLRTQLAKFKNGEEVKCPFPLPGRVDD